MALATKRWVRDELRGGPDHPRRLGVLSGPGMNWSIVALGYQLDPNGDDPDEVRIIAGEIDRVAVAQADVTVADDNYIYVRRTLSDNTMLVAAAAAIPADDATYIYYGLYQCTVSGGTASIKKILRPFNIEGGPVGYSGTVTVLTDFQYDATTCQLQKKTKLLTYKNGVLVTVGAESAWTLITGGQAAECDA